MNVDKNKTEEFTEDTLFDEPVLDTDVVGDIDWDALDSEEDDEPIKPNVKKQDSVEKQESSEEETIIEDDTEEEEEVEEVDKPTEKRGRKSKPTPYTEVVQKLIEKSENFAVYPGDEEKTDYNEEEVADLVLANISETSQELAGQIVEKVFSQLSPAMRKAVDAEFKGVKISDIASELMEQETLSEIPKDASDDVKENIVTKYYKELAKETSKSQDWIDKKVKIVLEGGYLDDEFEDAREYLNKKIEEKIAIKEKEAETLKEQDRRRKTFFKENLQKAYESDDLLINLNPAEKKAVYDSITNEYTRNDGKKKLGIKAQLDMLMYDTENTEESYKKLALISTIQNMSYDEFIKRISDKVGTSVNVKMIKQLKTANRSTAGATPNKTNSFKSNTKSKPAI